MSFSFSHAYSIDPAFSKSVAYFCMEFAIHQGLKTYAGGLGFLAGSHMRSAYTLRQNMVGIGILWNYGYYDQVWKADKTMSVLFQRKEYAFLQPTNIKFTINVSGHDVFVTAYYLPPEVFQTAPVFFLSTDLPENDYLSQTICHKLYDSNPETKIAASILLGEGGARLLEKLNWIPDVYHLNESHGLPLAFHLYKKFKHIEEVKKQLVFTNHTPEPGGNPKSNIAHLETMGFLCGIPQEEIKKIGCVKDGELDYTLTALAMAGLSNTVSRCHYLTLRQKLKAGTDVGPFISITNGQDFDYWCNEDMYAALEEGHDKALMQEKKNCKKILFEEIADQYGRVFNEDVLTIVFAKRFGGYKRPELLLHNMDRFQRLVTNVNRPIQIIWAGKPYPVDYNAIALFDRISNTCKTYMNCAILAGYELKLSRLLKAGADIWLNTPRLGHEASGTSGMSAAMNGAVNLSTYDGWFPEFARHKINSFVIPPCDVAMQDFEQDEADANQLYDMLEKEIIPLYYDDPVAWLSIVKGGMKDIIPQFDSKRMAAEYYSQLYTKI